MHLLKKLSIIRYYLLGKFIYSTHYEKKYLSGKHFEGSHKGITAIGWRWTVQSYRSCKRKGVNTDVPWPVSSDIRVVHPENINFHVDDLNNFQNLGNYFQAIGRTAVVIVMSVLEGIGAMLPMGLLLIPGMGVRGAVIAFLAGYAIVALCGPIYAILFWKRIPKTLSEWVTIPAGFGAADDERLDASIHSLEEAMTISSEVQKFCEKRNVDEKKAYYSALALEELCLGIIKDRFEADKKKHTIEVRVLHKGENIFMSLKDDCRPYNPQERADFLNPKDNSPKSMSIRLFMGIVKETEYQLTLGINVFTVTV